MLKVVQLLRPRCSTSQTLNTNNVRSYFKPSQKDVFYDVEGVVTKDVLLFRYDDTGKVYWRHMLAVGMLPMWAYLGYTSYSLKYVNADFEMITIIIV